MKNYKMADVFSLFFNVRIFPLFMTGTIALAVSANALYDLLLHYVGKQPSDYVKILFGCLLIIIFTAIIIIGILKVLQKRKPFVVSHPRPEKRKGLIFLLSREEPLMQAFNYHLPVLKACWLICSEQTESMAKEFRKTHIDDLDNIQIFKIADTFHWAETKTLIDDIYEKLPDKWIENDIITDLTGLTKPVSLGAILSCLIPGRPLEYVPAMIKEKGAYPVKIKNSVDPIEIRISYDSIRKNL